MKINGNLDKKSKMKYTSIKTCLKIQRKSTGPMLTTNDQNHNPKNKKTKSPNEKRIINGLILKSSQRPKP